MKASGADAVMFGRATYGRPWWPGAVAEAMEAGKGRAAPTLTEERDIALWHQQETLSLYGSSLGNKTFRKHLGWLLTRLHDRNALSAEALQTWRAKLVSNADNGAVAQGIKDVFSSLDHTNMKAAA
jgi:tRNA-dihydrouridine synthase B